MGEDAAVEVEVELALHVRRHWPVVVMTGATLGELGVEVLLDAAARVARLETPSTHPAGM